MISNTYIIRFNNLQRSGQWSAGMRFDVRRAIHRRHATNMPSIHFRHAPSRDDKSVAPVENYYPAKIFGVFSAVQMPMIRAILRFSAAWSRGQT
ncbi:MAG: hypothetical protein EOQ32_04205 [Mesorhizobium sp.]|nr:MAG: hypothetical protein EOQ32_04205 [Mesorhizobium sp.]